MTDKARCPHCSEAFDWDMLEEAGLWRKMGLLEKRLEPIWDLANEYMQAFRKKDGSKIRFHRRIRHLTRLAGLWEKQIFEFEGKRYRTTRPAIREALTKVCEAQKRGFNKHKYLKTVLLDVAELISAAGETAKEEQKREEKRRAEAANRETGDTEKKDAPMATAEFKQKIGALADQIGGKKS